MTRLDSFAYRRPPQAKARDVRGQVFKRKHNGARFVRNRFKQRDYIMIKNRQESATLKKQMRPLRVAFIHPDLGIGAQPTL